MFVFELAPNYMYEYVHLLFKVHVPEGMCALKYFEVPNLGTCDDVYFSMMNRGILCKITIFVFFYKFTCSSLRSY